MIAGYENLHLEKREVEKTGKPELGGNYCLVCGFLVGLVGLEQGLHRHYTSRQQNREIMHRARAQHDARFCIAVRLTFGRAKALPNAAESLVRFSEN